MDVQFFLKDKYVSKYPYASSFLGEKVLLSEELLKIRSGEYKLHVKSCRDAFRKSKEDYGRLKSKLAAITFCGLFEGSHKKENLISYNNLIIVDIDNIAGEFITETKEKLFSDKYILACWLSPSGNGLKALIPVSSEASMHRFCFDRVVDHLVANYNIQADISGSDICRLCYISDDSNLLIKEYVEPFPMEVDKQILAAMSSEKQVQEGEHLRFDGGIGQQTEKLSLYEVGERNKTEHKEMTKKILTYLKKTEQSITQNHHDWLKVAFAVSNTFTYDIGKNIFLEFCRLDGSMHNEYKSEQLLGYCYRKRRVGEINFGSIVYLAVRKGFIVPRVKKNKKIQ